MRDRLDRLPLPPYPKLMPRLLAAALVALSTSAASAASPSPFAPPPQPAEAFVRLLAPSGAFRTGTLQTFEKETGLAVAYDAYGDPAHIPAMMKDGPYDVVILPGPDIARAAAAGQLRRIGRDQIPNARNVAPQVAAKLAAYDPGGRSMAWGWSATGLLYDAAKAPPLLGGVPNSWSAALNPNVAGKLAPCGVALPDSRDELFAAAFRTMGADPARLRDRQIVAAADLILAARKVARIPVSRDPVTAIASGAVCLTLGGAPQAEIATRRSREGGPAADIRFAAPREGATITIDALAEPADAPHPREASMLIDFLLRPEVAAQATAAAGLMSAGSVAPGVNFRALWPAALYDPKTAELVEKEWSRIQNDERQSRRTSKRGAAKTEAKAQPAANKGAKTEAAKGAHGGRAKSGHAKGGHRTHQ